MIISKKILILVSSFLFISYAAIAYGASLPDYRDTEELVGDGKLAEAKAILEERLAADAKDIRAITILGEIYLKEGDKARSLKYLLKANGLDPSYPLAHLYLGRTYFMMGDFDRSMEEFEKFKDIARKSLTGEYENERYIDALHDISHTYLEIKKYDEAYKTLEEILRLMPKDQIAMYNLGIYYYQYDRNRPRAYQNFSKAIEIDPGTQTANRARYAIEFMRRNPDSRIEPDFSFLDKE